MNKTVLSQTKSHTTFGDDISFMQKYTPIVELSDVSGESRIAVAPDLQGRVMTSTAFGNEGRSYGWINKTLFESKEISEHINAYGGEERFWLGPEGGQYSIFFKEGTEFTLDNWYTPKLLDLEPFNVKSKSFDKVVFTKKASLINYSNFKFDFDIEREVSVLSEENILKEFKIASLGKSKTIAYKTINKLVNTGADWNQETGLLSIWMLGMFNPSPNTTIIVPYILGDEAELGIPVNDTYFGKVPSERLVVKKNVIYFSGDGEYRSKIGLSPMRAKNILGSFDTKNNVLTIVKYNKPESVKSYVNSMWEIQKEPYTGDVVNSYNDGAPTPNEKPLGPFYELETSSPALELKTGESAKHIQFTCHIEGDIDSLEPILKQVFNVSIDDVKTAFK